MDFEIHDQIVRENLEQENAILRDVLEEIVRRSAMLIHQNTGRWSMSIEHDKRSYDVTDTNIAIAQKALKA
jgi:hypothetical protein